MISIATWWYYLFSTSSDDVILTYFALYYDVIYFHFVQIVNYNDLRQCLVQFLEIYFIYMHLMLVALQLYEYTNLPKIITTEKKLANYVQVL